MSRRFVVYEVVRKGVVEVPDDIPIDSKTGDRVIAFMEENDAWPNDDTTVRFDIEVVTPRVGAV